MHWSSAIAYPCTACTKNCTLCYLSYLFCCDKDGLQENHRQHTGSVASCAIVHDMDVICCLMSAILQYYVSSSAASRVQYYSIMSLHLLSHECNITVLSLFICCLTSAILQYYVCSSRCRHSVGFMHIHCVIIFIVTCHIM